MKKKKQNSFMKIIALAVILIAGSLRASAQDTTSGRVIPIPIPPTPPEKAPHIDKDHWYTALG